MKLAFLAALVVVCIVPCAAQPVTGAIFTTLADGSAVNENHFDSKCSVYLNGGPGKNAPARAAGLADGEYYFQVTDPSGGQLLSTDPVSNRRFTVRNGVIVAYTGTEAAVHPTGVDVNHPELGAITVRLANATCPEDFLDTPNNGGAYKVWVTPAADFAVDCTKGCFHGFVASKSKTDNFKVVRSSATFCLTLQKQWVTLDGWVAGTNWPIQVTDPTGATNTYFTGETGETQVCGLTEGMYTVTEDPGLNAWVDALEVNGVSLPAEPVYTFTWTAGKPAPVVLFRNNNLPPI
jgi:hypothetical protein